MTYLFYFGPFFGMYFDDPILAFRNDVFSPMDLSLACIIGHCWHHCDHSGVASPAIWPTSSSEQPMPIVLHRCVILSACLQILYHVVRVQNFFCCRHSLNWLAFLSCFFVHIPMLHPVILFPLVCFYGHLFVIRPVAPPLLTTTATNTLGRCSLCDPTWILKLRSSSVSLNEWQSFLVVAANPNPEWF